MGNLADQNRARRIYRPKCRHCGKGLDKYTHNWWNRDGSPKPSVGADSKYGTVKQIISDKTSGYDDTTFVSYWCGRWGRQGNGYFCSLRCGYAWAVRHAEERDK